MNDKAKKNIRVIRTSAMKMPEWPLVNKYAHGKTAETTAISKVIRDGTLADVVLTALYHTRAFDAASAVKMKRLVSAMREVQKVCGYNKDISNTYSDLCNRLANHGWLDKTDNTQWFFIESAQNKITGGRKGDENCSNEASPQPAPSGAGFGNPEENKKVEEAAIAVVKEKYDLAGWKVRSVERDKCGFDLECHKGETTENVEVKGVSGTEQSFFITAGEVEQAKINSKFVLIVVTSALSSSPVLSRCSGPEFDRRFELKVVLYRAALRPDKCPNGSV